MTAIVIISEESCRLIGVDLVSGAGRAHHRGQLADPPIAGKAVAERLEQ